MKTMRGLLFFVGLLVLAFLPLTWHAIRPHIEMRKHSREGFGFVMESAYGERMDTFAGTITKDMVGDPDTTIAVRFRESDLDSIYRMVIETRFFDLPGPHPSYDTIYVMPHTQMTLLVQAGSVRKELSWDTGRVDVHNLSDEWKRLFDLMREIQRIQESYPEYRALPTPRGGYM